MLSNGHWKYVVPPKLTTIAFLIFFFPKWGWVLWFIRHHFEKYSMYLRVVCVHVPSLLVCWTLVLWVYYLIFVKQHHLLMLYFFHQLQVKCIGNQITFPAKYNSFYHYQCRLGILEGFLFDMELKQGLQTITREALFNH